MVNKKCLAIAFALVLMVSPVLCIFGDVSGAAVSKSYDVKRTTYEFADNKGYIPSDSAKVSKMSFGGQYGTLRINGASMETFYNGKTAYATEGTLSLTYSASKSVTSDLGSNWRISSDTATSVNKISLGSSIGKGTLVMTKSTDGKNYEKVYSEFGLFEKPSSFLYTILGSDVGVGTYFKVYVAYEIYNKHWADIFGIFTEHRNCLEVYEFYVASNDGTIQYQDIAVQNYDRYVSEGYDAEVVKNGSSLLDGSTTVKGIRVDYSTNPNYSVSVSYNGGGFYKVKNGDTFTNNGKYNFKVVTVFGKTVYNTMYVFSEEDKGYSTYFGTKPLDGIRVYSEDTLPTYESGLTLNINRNVNIPSLYGVATNLTTGETVQITTSTNTYEFVNEGVWSVVLINYNNSGSGYKYTFTFIIQFESTTPQVNQNLIKISYSENIASYKAKHYEVVYQMTAGGYMYACFPDDAYTAAFAFAFELEKRYITEESTGLEGVVGSYYKSPDNPNVKILYLDNNQLIQTMNKYAKLNVNVAFFNPLLQISYQTIEDVVPDDHEGLLERLEMINLSSDIHIFTSGKIKEECRENTNVMIFDDFEFIQVGDYESNIVTIISKNGASTSIGYGEKVGAKLSESGIYTIYEEDIYGRNSTYEVLYLHEIDTKLNLVVDTKAVSVDSQNYGSIFGNSISISSAVNEHDSEAMMIIINAETGLYQTYSVKEIKNLKITEDVLILLIDRVGNHYGVFIDVIQDISEVQSKNMPALIEKISSLNQDMSYISTLEPNISSDRYVSNSMPINPVEPVDKDGDQNGGDPDDPTGDEDPIIGRNILFVVAAVAGVALIIFALTRM